MATETPEEREARQYKQLLRDYGRLAADNPDMIGEMRESLKFSAAFIISNRQETVIQFRKLVGELDAFLAACQTGEIDLERFLKALGEEE
ncbi:MAG: hypothetical protein V2B18_21130 [Pseudomonadota bacterium]